MTRTAPSPRPWCLISDIDDTLTGDAAALERLAEAVTAARDRLWFAVNSSRPKGSVARTLGTVFPPALVPDARITALGTEIEIDGALLESWQGRFAGWPRAEIFEALRSLGHTPHDAEYQTDLKVSFAVPKGAAVTEAMAVLARLPCQIIASGQSDFDVLPPGAGKGAASLFLARTLGCTADQVIVAGDSGNDLDMFRAVSKGIAVQNARPELLEALSPGSFIHSSAPHAGGVLEGLHHYGVFDPAPPAQLKPGGRTDG